MARLREEPEVERVSGPGSELMKLNENQSIEQILVWPPQLPATTLKSLEPPLPYPGATPDAERAQKPLLPEPPYKPYAKKPALPEPPYKPYAKKPALPGPPYEPYKGM
jgi:hypothetical protein